MASFKQFLSMFKGSPKLEDFLTTLREDCGQFITASTVPLFRGTSTAPTTFQKKTIRRNRNTLSNSAQSATAIDDAAEKKLGVRPRTQTLFVTPKLQQADVYGQVCMVFMIGDFRPIILDGSYDLYGEMRGLAKEALPGREWPEEGTLKNILSDEEWKKVGQHIANKMKVVSLADASKRHGEIMMDGTEYYLINKKWLEKEFKLSPEQFLKMLKG